MRRVRLLLRDRRSAYVLLGLLAVAYAVTHIFASSSDAANWDELALLRRAQEAAITGDLQTGGRPGMGVIALLPIVDGCTSVVNVVDTARLVWAIATFALLGGLFELLRRATRRSPYAWHTAALGTALLAFVPVFLRWSLQIRTDQPAIAAAVWAGVALLASRERFAWAILGGALAATGYLFSQKALYIVALAGVVTAGDLYIAKELDWRREARRAAGFVAGAIAVVGAYKVITPMLWSTPGEMSLDAGFDLLNWYRFILRYRLYPAMVTSLLPHIALLSLILIAAIRAFRRDTEQRRPLLVALVIALLGIGVGRFHTASFPYFWITLGVFPATAIAMGWNGIRELLPRAHVPIAAATWLALLVLGARYRAETLRDTQYAQRATYGLIDEHVPTALKGFSADGALVCGRGLQPLPVFFGHDISERFSGANGPRYTEDFIQRFRTIPIAFMVQSRVSTFPEVVKKFWSDHYVPYSAAVSLAGHTFTGATNSQHTFDLLVAGRYRWLPGATAARISIGGTLVTAGDAIELVAGAQTAELLDPVTDGKLVFAIDAPPGPTDLPFYDATQIQELLGNRRSWW